MQQKSIVLIGMPGSGKSTLGVQLAKNLALDFVDTDLLIQKYTGEPLQVTLDKQGYQALRDIECQVLCTMEPERYGHSVIATGGSAVYSEKAMTHLASFATLVYLLVPEQELLKRIGNFATRGIAKRDDQSFSDLFLERHQLYQQYAQMTLDQMSDGHSLSQQACLDELTGLMLN